MKTILCLSISVLLLLTACHSVESPVKTGLDRVGQYQDQFAGKRLGIITNHTAYNRQGKHILDVFMEMQQTRVTAVFGPEHGIRGDQDAGAVIDHQEENQIPIYSLYGETRKPTPQMLEEVDVLIFDIQDVGVRFYTYIWTMSLAMEAAAEQGIPFIVLDRPNPINGIDVEGNILETAFATFVGLYPIPVRHGMTVGELARLFNGEGRLAGGVQADLTVIPMEGWQRERWFDQTGLTFMAPSPNMPDLQTAMVYPGLCLLEGTNVSEGRGTYQPFLQFGAPWIDKATFADELNHLNLPGVRFEAHEFTPVSIPGMSTNPKHQDVLCYGARIIVTDRNQFKPYWTGIRLVEKTYRLYPVKLEFRVGHFDRLCGTAKIREAILAGQSLEEQRKYLQADEERFAAIREKYLIY
jgi:uncharacterized protein YbbC (DUF1343 family)